MSGNGWENRRIMWENPEMVMKILDMRYRNDNV